VGNASRGEQVYRWRQAYITSGLAKSGVRSTAPRLSVSAAIMYHSRVQLRNREQSAIFIRRGPGVRGSVIRWATMRKSIRSAIGATAEPARRDGEGRVSSRRSMVNRPKALAKRAVVSAIARTAPLAWRWRRQRSLVVLMYHRVLPKDSPARQIEQPGMYVSPETLDLHLTELKRYFELVHLDEWLRRAKQGAPLPKLACAITFDDGWRDNYDFALPELMKHSAPATIFLVSSYIGTTYRFWPNQLISLLQKSFAAPGSVSLPQPLGRIVEPLLAEARDRGRLTVEDVDRAVQEAKTFDEQEIRRCVDAAEMSCENASAAAEILNGEEVAKMSATGMIRFGSHTATHFRLGGRMSSQQLEREIVGSRKVLQALSGQAIDLFCYPNGDTSPAAVDLVRRHYLGAVTTRKGWHSADGDPHLIQRVGVHEDVSSTRAPFLERLSSWR